MPRKLIYQEIKEYIESFSGYKLISTEYINNKTKLQIRCPKGHLFWIKYNDFCNGHGCYRCYNDKRSSIRRHDFDYVKSFIESEGYELLSDNYLNNKTKIKVRCPNKHEYWVRFDSFKFGKRCLECSGFKRISDEYLIKNLYKYDSIRKRNGKLETTCKYCGKWFVPYREDLIRRVRYINGEIDKEYKQYCSDNCKSNCPIFNQKKWPKGKSSITSREVQPELRQLVFERDNYTCQKCGIHKDELESGIHCHHIFPLNESPIESADRENCVTLCKNCHKEAHQISGCTYSELRCS